MLIQPLETKLSTILQKVILGPFSYACMQASPDPTHGARVLLTARLEENRRTNQVLGCNFRIY